MIQGDFYIIKTEHVRNECIAHINQIQPKNLKPTCVKLVTPSDVRRDSQNSLYHRWHSDMAKQSQEYEKKYYERFCKLQFGVPIRVEDCPVYAGFWRTVKDKFGGNAQAMLHPEEPDQPAVIDLVPVTRDMNVSQMNRMMTEIQRVMSQKFRLTDPALLGL